MSTKVFVGNLLFSTTGDELKTEFGKHANVVSANIITRGRRSLGYGFVEFASEADATKAADAMNKKEISGRAINVEVARPRDPTKEGEAAESKPRQPRAPRAPRAEGGNNAAAGGAVNGGNNNRRPRGPRRNNGEGAAAPANGAAAAATSSSPAGARAPRRGGPRTNNGPRTSAPRRPRTEQDQRPPSDTTLFVANVPFSTDDAQLQSFFAEYHPKSAHVVRMRNGRSRGYGFVEFDTAEGQKAGLAVDGKDVPLPNGTTLKLSVKVAMTPPVPSATDAAAAAPATN